MKLRFNCDEKREPKVGDVYKHNGYYYLIILDNVTDDFRAVDLGVMNTSYTDKDITKLYPVKHGTYIDKLEV